MQSHERVRELLASERWTDVESGLDRLREGGAPAIAALKGDLDARLPSLVDHENWRVRRGLARLLAELERPLLLDRLGADPDHRVARAARESAATWTERARKQEAAERLDRRLARRLEAARERFGDEAAREIQALAFERLGTVAERVGHDLLGTVATLRRVEEILRAHVDEATLGEQDWQRSVGALPRLAAYLQSFAQDFREFLRAPAPREVVAIQALIASAVADAEAAVGPGAHAHVRQEVGASLRAEVPPGDVARCVANLVKNALEATTPTGSVRVRAWSQDDSLWIRVTDDGKGMSDDMKARCFEPLLTSKQAGGGRPCGLGLAIVQRKVEEHLRGRVTVESAPGQGTTITLQLPGVVVE